jgi:hypothetical protein
MMNVLPCYRFGPVRARSRISGEVHSRRITVRPLKLLPLSRNQLSSLVPTHFQRRIGPASPENALADGVPLRARHTGRRLPSRFSTKAASHDRPRVSGIHSESERQNASAGSPIGTSGRSREFGSRVCGSDPENAMLRGGSVNIVAQNASVASRNAAQNRANLRMALPHAGP